MSKFKKCPCGETPNKLSLGVINEDGYHEVIATPDCCGEWPIRFSIEYRPPGLWNDEFMDKVATDPWNNKPRGTDK